MKELGPISCMDVLSHKFFLEMPKARGTQKGGADASIAQCDERVFARSSEPLSGAPVSNPSASLNRPAHV